MIRFCGRRPQRDDRSITRARTDSGDKPEGDVIQYMRMIREDRSTKEEHVMSDEKQILVYHTFQGGRFVDHGIDLDVLVELVRFRDIVVDLAKILWKRNNPGKQRLPKNFEESLALKFYEIQPNCATIPLARAGKNMMEPRLFEYEDENVELDEAADLVFETIEAVGADRPIPEAFPAELLDRFNDYGKSLRDDEWIEQRRSENGGAARYDSNVRQKLSESVQADYEADVDVIGTVTMARVSSPKMAIELKDGGEAEAIFDPVDEEKITTALKDHAQAKLHVIGSGRFSSDGKLKKITKIHELILLPLGDREFDPSAKSIWEEFQEIIDKMPQSLIDSLPVDGSERHDYYIYGKE